MGPSLQHRPPTVFIAALLAVCWLGMQVVHECGHVLAAWATGGTVTAVVLHPLAISRTDVSPNPHPLAVVWGGPTFGAALPLAAWAVAFAARLPIDYLLRFFAGFCLVANGIYIGYGVVEPVGDASDMLRHGTPVWALAAFGLATVPAGFALWHGQGSSFGLGAAPSAVPRRHVWGSVVLLALMVVLEMVWSMLTGFR